MQFNIVLLAYLHNLLTYLFIYLLNYHS